MRDVSHFVRYSSWKCAEEDVSRGFRAVPCYLIWSLVRPIGRMCFLRGQLPCVLSMREPASLSGWSYSIAMVLNLWMWVALLGNVKIHMCASECKIQLWQGFTLSVRYKGRYKGRYKHAEKGGLYSR